jgi:geranylgeranyl reductase family protein
VLLLDRARFPRDKPCGGGVTIRAARRLPFPVEPAVEDVVHRVELRHRGRPVYERTCSVPLVLMTQRRRLDALLAERAAAAAADFRDGVRVTDVRPEATGVVVSAGRERFAARAVVAADGVNGVAARRLGLCERPLHGVALEANLSHRIASADRFRGRIVFDLGVVRGGYGWVFPKGDHVNVGVGGWGREAPSLRERLADFCTDLALPVDRLEGLRGYRLPVARPDAVLARGPALAVGDAAGLVDPLSGDGIYEAFVSAELAAAAVGDLLAGTARGLEPYELALRRRLSRQLANAWAAKRALDRFPGVMLRLVKLELVQRTLERLARDDAHPPAARRLARPVLLGLGAAARTRLSSRP